VSEEVDKIVAANAAYRRVAFNATHILAQIWRIKYNLGSITSHVTGEKLE
jgi:hypothetical protein